MSSATLVSDRASALDYLYGRINYERTTEVPYRSQDFKLDRMRQLLALLGDPHLAFPAVHIAGTKGKGSTAAMIARCLREAGLRTGLYTSPHLERLEERIVCDEAEIAADEFVPLVALLQETVDRLDRDQGVGARSATFFEITTALAFVYFARQKLDVAVLEVGLGGRLDSTNVCRPAVSVITSISFDHMRQLGWTLAAIAGEKAGIIKPGVPVVSGVQQAEPRGVIEAVARDVGAPLFTRPESFDLTCRPEPAPALPRFDYRERTASGSSELSDVALAMPGEHQAANAAVALAALNRLGEAGWNLPEAALRTGLASVRCPARIELFPGSPPLVIDAAHNVASIAALVACLEQQYSARRRLLVFGTSKDKDVPGMLRLLLPQFERAVFTRYVHNPRSVEPEELAQLARRLAPELAAAPQVEIASTPPEAWQRLLALQAETDLACIAGSFFLAAELRPLAVAARG